MSDTTAESHDDANCRILHSQQGRDLVFEHLPGEQPGIAFLGGFRSNMSGGKALHLRHWCQSRKRRFLRLDYSGHGRSSGRFEDGCIGDWLDDTEQVFDAAGQGRWILVGSSMGAWITLLLALRRPDLCRAIVTLAAATDFSERLLWTGLDARQRQLLQENGSVAVWSEYDQAFFTLSRRLFEDARQYLLLGAEIGLDCPVRLIHGLADAEVPWRNSVDTAERLRSSDVEILLLKHGDHRLSEADNLDRLTEVIEALVETSS